MKATKKMKSDNRLHNTELLLRNYTRFKQHVNNAVHSSDEITKITDVEFGFMELEVTDQAETYINSILRTKERTQVIIEHIDRLIEVYKKEAAQNDNEEQEMRYQVVENMFLIDNKKSVRQLAMKLNVSGRTIYRCRKNAIEDLSVLFFGVDAIRIVSKSCQKDGKPWVRDMV